MRNHTTILIPLLLLYGTIILEARGVRAQGVRYVYDDLGRLIRVIDETTGEAASYNYDAVGNILSIERGPGDLPNWTAGGDERHGGALPAG